MADVEKWKSVGERVGALIRLRGYKSVELFAHEHNIDKSVLNRLINGRREVRLSTFLKITEALEVSIPELAPESGISVREKDPGEGRARAKAPEAGGRTYRFVRGEFDKIEVRASSRDRSPVVIESNRKKPPGLSVRSKTFKMDL